MMQIPEAGSEWKHNASGAKWKIVFADTRSVLIEFYNGVRRKYDTPDFVKDFKPAQRKIKHRRWVNLYKNGDTGGGWLNKEDAIRVAGYDRDYIAETRLIEWEVEE